MTPEMLGVLGTLILIALAINAFFIRDLVEKLNEVRTGVAVIKSEMNGIQKRVDTSENNQNNIFERLHALETKGKRNELRNS